MSRSASAQVQINAVGDTKPQFKQSIYSGTIEEERDPGTVILKVGHEDCPESGANSRAHPFLVTVLIIAEVI